MFGYLNDFYYHGLNKSDMAYFSFKTQLEKLKKIIDSGAILSTELRNSERIKSSIRFNGYKFVSLTEYVKPETESIYRSEPVDIDTFHETYSTKDWPGYYSYLKYMRKYVFIDLYQQYGENLFTDPVLNFIAFKENVTRNDSIREFFMNPSAYEDYIRNGIGFVIEKKIDAVSTILLPEIIRWDYDNETLDIIDNSKTKRYSHYIGEVQIENKVTLDKIVAILIDYNYTHKEIKIVLEELKINLPVVRADEEKGMLYELKF